MKHRSRPSPIGWRSPLVVLSMTGAIACGDNGQEVEEETSGASETSGTSGAVETAPEMDESTSANGDNGDNGDSSTTGDTATTGGDERACGYGLGGGGLTFSIRVDDPLAHLLTETDRPDTGEVYCVPSDPVGEHSLVMVPGLGLSHYVFLTTPDRRDGWASLLADAGVTAHVFNPARNLSTVDDPNPAESWSMWLEDTFWQRWGFGPQPRDPHPDGRFPIANADDFIAHLPWYGPGPGGMSVSQSAIDEVVELLEEVGPSVLMVHSAAGRVGFSIALDRPELLTALIVVEPTGCPTEAAEAPLVPFLALYGDYIGERGQTNRLAACQTTRDLVEAAGYPAALFSYPDMDVFGNTHLMMQDDNNDRIVSDMLQWLDLSVWR